MTRHSGTSWGLGLIVALAFGALQPAAAQAPRTKPDTAKKADTVRKTPTPQKASSQRIRISKEAPGEVAPPPDTVIAPPPPPPPVEEVLPPPPPPPPPPAPVAIHVPGFFMGVGGGLAFNGMGNQSEVGLGVDCIPGQPGDPMNGLRGAGFNITVPFGWMPVYSPVGLRFDVAYSQFNRQGTWLADNGATGFYNTRPQVLSTSADVKFRLPLARISPYAVAGVSYNRYRITADRTGSDPIDNSIDRNWHNAFGANAGGGLEFGFGRTALFVESRYFTASGVRHFPVILGLTWY